MAILAAFRRLGAGVIAAALLAAAPPAGAKTYPDPEAPSLALSTWRSEAGVRTLTTEFAGRELTIPLQAITGAFSRRGGPGEEETVAVLWIEATLPDLRTLGADNLAAFRRAASGELLWLRLHADVPPGMLDRMQTDLAVSLQRGRHREISLDRWHDLRLYALTDSRQPPLMEGFYAAGERRRYVACRLVAPPGRCTATYQRPDGLTVEYSFGLQYLERLDWLDEQVHGLLAGFISR